MLKGCKTPEQTQLATYFGANYVRGAKKRGRYGGYDDPHFKLDIWNLHQATLNQEPTTNNIAEAFHRHIQMMLNDTNMSFTSFLEKLSHSVVTYQHRLEQVELHMDEVRRNKKSIKRAQMIEGTFSNITINLLGKSLRLLHITLNSISYIYVS